mgnify:CR=1 FL=1
MIGGYTRRVAPSPLPPRSGGRPGLPPWSSSTTRTISTRGSRDSGKTVSVEVRKKRTVVKQASADDYDKVVATAREGFKQWRMTPGPQRGAVHATGQPRVTASAAEPSTGEDRGVRRRFQNWLKARIAATKPHILQENDGAGPSPNTSGRAAAAPVTGTAR